MRYHIGPPLERVDDYIRRTIRRALERPSILEPEGSAPLDDMEDMDDFDLEPADQWGNTRRLPVRYDEANEDDF